MPSRTPSVFSEPTLPLPQWANIRLELLWAYEGEVMDDGKHLRLDHSNQVLAWLLLQGSVRLAAEGKEWTIHAGQWVILPKAVTQQDFSDDARLISIHVTCQWETGEDLLSERDIAILDAKEFPLLEKNARALIDSMQNDLPDVDMRMDRRRHIGTYRLYLRIQSSLTIWIESLISIMIQQGRTFAYARSINERVMNAARCLSTTPLREHFPDAALKAISGVGRVQLDRMFQREFGMTTLEYWSNRRLQAAKGYLETNNKPLKELSAYLGFNHPANLTRWFVQKTGLSPSEYRKQRWE